MHGLEAKYQGAVKFTYLDRDDSATEPFKSALGYRYQPHLFLLAPDGTVIMEWLGWADGKELDQALLDAVSTY